MITERAMLAAVHIRLWTATKYDKKASEEVANQHGAHTNAGRYNKRLLQGATKLEALQTIAGQIRQHFYKLTLPWSDEGFRILPAELLFDFAEGMRALENRFVPAVDAFIAAYPAYIEQMRPALNGLFRSEDYESPDTIRSKFGLRLEIKPIPSGDDFRVKLSREQRARLAEEIDRDVRESLSRGTRDLWMRLRKVVAHMVEILNDPEARLHTSVVDNVTELVDLLPRLNVTGDPQLDAFAVEIRNRLCLYNSRELKQNDQIRSETARDAAAIMERIETVLDQQPEIAGSDMMPSEQLSAEAIFSRMSAYLEVPPR